MSAEKDLSTAASAASSSAEVEETAAVDEWSDRINEVKVDTSASVHRCLRSRSELTDAWADERAVTAASYAVLAALA